MFAASERVREDIGKVAIMRGPVVYCLEEKDNGKNLHELLVDTDMHASVSEGKICDTVVKMVETDGWRLTESGDAEETLYHMYQKPQKQRYVCIIFRITHGQTAEKTKCRYGHACRTLKGSAADCGIALA